LLFVRFVHLFAQHLDLAAPGDNVAVGMRFEWLQYRVWKQCREGKQLDRRRLNWIGF
jgi:hypothetical protein